jgi:L-lactate dehydrogenase complex protein LldG
MESSRDAILRAVRQRQPEAVPHPGSFSAGIVYDDRVRQFGESLATVGGQLIIAPDQASARSELIRLPVIEKGGAVCSLFPELLTPTVSLENVDDPHALENVDIAVLPGEIAVAENAAIWFSGSSLRHRVLPFITQHLVLVVPSANVVNTMHEAFDRLQFADRSFGVFISGPSKTADIEQSLVIGAHGPRSLAVILLG